jgi:ABC-type transport system involved in cytochrome c biogenesis permease component
MKSFYKNLLATIVIVFPLFSFAATFKEAVASITNIGGLLMPLLFSIALAWFIWGVADFIRSADNPEQRKKGKQRMLWSILALTAMVGYLGLASVFTNTFFGSNANVLPQLFE